MDLSLQLPQPKVQLSPKTRFLINTAIKFESLRRTLAFILLAVHVDVPAQSPISMKSSTLARLSERRGKTKWSNVWTNVGTHLKGLLSWNRALKWIDSSFISYNSYSWHGRFHGALLAGSKMKYIERPRCCNSCNACVPGFQAKSCFSLS